MTKAGSAASIYHPRYWGLWSGIGLLWLLARLPHATQLWTGRCLGRVLYRLARKRRRIAEINIGLCFPEIRPEAQVRLVRATFESFGMCLLETGAAWLRGVDHLAGCYEVNGLEHIEQAHNDGCGVLLIGAHFSTLDLAGAFATRHMQMDVVFRPSPNPVFDRLQRRGRGRHFERIYSKTQTRDIIRGLQAGRTVWYAQDQNFGQRQAVFAPFFGIQAATIRGTSRLLAITGARAIFCSHFRLDGGRRYRVDFSPVLENFPGPDETTDATRINQLIENAIRQHPEQYLWLHQRFKTRPEGEPPIYKPGRKCLSP